MCQSGTISGIAPVHVDLGHSYTPDCGANSGEQGLFRADGDQDLVCSRGVENEVPASQFPLRFRAGQ